MRFSELFNREPSRDEGDTRTGAQVISQKLAELKWTPPTRERTGVRLTKRAVKYRRDNFLTALMHTPMVDWEALRAKADAETSERGYIERPPLALREVLREARNARKAARRLARSSRPKLVITTTPKLCAAPVCERLPEAHGKPMCGPHWYRVDGVLRRSILAGGGDLRLAKNQAVTK